MFTGHQWDGESGLYYALFRYYSPLQARWTTRDPLGMVSSHAKPPRRKERAATFEGDALRVPPCAPWLFLY
ncbi:MAG: RHS repeat-associated core domain-containing protein [Candidatus Hydrogenedentota bacterium]